MRLSTARNSRPPICANPLDELLREVSRRPRDAAVRQWASALLDGEEGSKVRRGKSVGQKGQQLRK
jgi:hypothetical protein